MSITIRERFHFIVFPFCSLQEGGDLVVLWMRGCLLRATRHRADKAHVRATHVGDRMSSGSSAVNAPLHARPLST